MPGSPAAKQENGRGYGGLGAPGGDLTQSDRSARV